MANGNREPTLEWKGKSDGAAPLRYLVQVSPDGKTGWQVIAVGTTATELALTREQWEQYAGWFARAIANDGYNDSEPEVTRLRKGRIWFLRTAAEDGGGPLPDLEPPCSVADEE